MDDTTDDKIFTIITNNENDTIKWGRTIGVCARPGDFIGLTGPVGAGKTVFATGVLEGLGVIPDMGSPTFTIVHEYEGRHPVIHVDLYRLGEAAHGEDIGWDELFHGKRVAVVEWAEFVRCYWPGQYLLVRMERQEGLPRTRRITFRGRGARGRALVEALSTRNCG